MERMRDRLADRDLEIKILQKRMSLRRGSASGNNNDDSESKVRLGSGSCIRCREKDGLVSDLYQKLRNLENIVEAFCSTDEKSPKNTILSESKDLILEADLDQVHSCCPLNLKNLNEKKIVYFLFK
jgi:hypothetical protein